MSNLNNRLDKLENINAPADRKILVVIYDPETGRATDKSAPEIRGMTREEITAKFDSENIVFLNVVYIPDNGRDK